MRKKRGEKRSGGEAAELAALADGSLPAERRRELEAQVARSPRLQALLAEQHAALEAVHARDERAPQQLRDAIEARRGEPSRRLRPRVVVAATLAAATAGVLVVLALPGSGPVQPKLAEATAFASRPATSREPVSRPGEEMLRSVAVAGVRYPDWAHEYGWRARGSRVDRLGSRRAVTVFYEKGSRRVAYTILSGGPLAIPRSSRLASWEGRLRHVFSVGGRDAVTWERDGHTCLLSGDGVRSRLLLELTA
jgi:hypothetical protein